MKKEWKYYEADKQKVEEIKEKYNINEILATVLVNRGILDEEEIRVFLEPTRNDFRNPFDMPDMEKAVERIMKAIDEKEKVIVYGDYDVDGITSITVLKRFLAERNLNIDTYIPNRLEEGYGLNKKAIEKIAQKRYTLMITVDCGISGIEEIDYANSLGIDVVITDHHEPAEKLPNAVAIVDCKRKDNKYGFRELAGVGVVFKLIQALSIEMGLEEKKYLKYLDIVCLGTISDIVPLIDENRVIAKLGLKLTQMTNNLGLKSVINSSGYNQIDSNTISFGVAPRINACGRMGHQDEALQVFLSNDKNEVIELTHKLNEYNKERQDTEKNIEKEVIEQIRKNNLENANSIVLGSDNWHHGVIGIVASKITDMYYKPCILICFEDEKGKGSGRSIPGFDLHEALSKCTDTIDKYGGHAMAIGINVNKEKFEDFRKEFEDVVSQSDINELAPIIEIDKQIELDDISMNIIKSLDLLKPFGEGNRIPLFSIKNVRIDSIRTLSEGKHLKLTLKSKNNFVDAIGFNLGHFSNDLLIGDKINIVGALEINSFNGCDRVQINLKDIMKSL